MKNLKIKYAVLVNRALKVLGHIYSLDFIKLPLTLPAGNEYLRCFDHADWKQWLKHRPAFSFSEHPSIPSKKYPPDRCPPIGIMFQKETKQIQEERSICIWPLMSRCKGHDHPECILNISTDKLYPAASSQFTFVYLLTQLHVWGELSVLNRQ